MKLVNDRQSRLNETSVSQLATPESVDQISELIALSRETGLPISVSGGMHAMGGQQFASGSIHLSLQRFRRVLSFDRQKGLIEVESGIMWPELIDFLHRAQADGQTAWAIRQKQTGVDQVSLGGSLAANIHGRGLMFPPFVSDIESFEILDHKGQRHRCSRSENAELFSLAIGGYGLFGIVTRLTLRLTRRLKVKRQVEIIAVRNLLPRIDAHIAEGFLYGDCQYSIDLGSDAEFHPGVFSCYKPVAPDTPLPDEQRGLAAKDWADLYRLSRQDKARAFAQYAQYYLGTSGQVYWSDRQQLSNVFQGYSETIDVSKGTEMITEVYLSAEACNAFLVSVRSDFAQHDVDMTYGTIRFIEPDTDTFLPWARQRRVCVVCNLHVIHTPEGIEKAQRDFRRIIDRVIEFEGSFFLTYHRWATRPQIEACYPEFADFLQRKLQHDPEERFQSDWYRHYKSLLT